MAENGRGSTFSFVKPFFFCDQQAEEDAVVFRFPTVAAVLSMDAEGNRATRMVSLCFLVTHVF